MPKLDLDSIPQSDATGYPEHLSQQVRGRLYRRLSQIAGIADFGACHTVLQPGAWSSQRHWHDAEDELVVMLSGHATLVEDDVETLLSPGDIAAFPKGVPNGHVLQNRSDAPCTFLAIGGCGPGAIPGDCNYPDVDLHYDAAQGRMCRKDGAPF